MLRATELLPDWNLTASTAWRELAQGDDRARALPVLETTPVKGLRVASPLLGLVNDCLSFRERDGLLIAST